MKKLARSVCLLATALLSVCLFGASNCTWLGTEDSRWSNAANWDGQKPPATGDNVFIECEGNNPAVIADGDVHSFSIFCESVYKGLIGVVNQTGGKLTITGNGIGCLGVGTFSFQPGTKEGWNVYNLSGGEIVTTGSNTGMYICRWSRGRFVQTGGSLTLTGDIWMSVEAGSAREAEYLMSGGTLTQTTPTSIVRMGVKGDSKWELSGTAVANLGSTLELGYGEGVTLGGDARLSLTKIVAAGDGAAQAKFTFDGGTLALKDGATKAGEFVSGLSALTVRNGDAKVEIPAGAVANFCVPLTAADGSTGGLVKRGGGTLILAAGNTYAGQTVVEQGVLGLNEPIDVDTLTLASGANVMIKPSQWSADALAALTAKAKAAGNDNYLVMDMEITLADGEVRMLAEDLDLGENSLILRGNGILKLTGNNKWTGDTIVYGGTLAAKRGVGLPTTSKLVLGGGAWAPLDGTGTVVAQPGTDKFAVSSGNPLALAAVDTVESVDLSGNGGVWAKPSDIGRIELNRQGDAALTVTNGLALNSATTISVGKGTTGTAETVFSGAITAAGDQTFEGDGKAVFTGTVNGGNYVWNLSAKETVLDGAKMNVKNPYVFSATENAELVITNGGSLTTTADIRIGEGANGARGTVTVADGKFETTGYLHIGRRGKGVGTLNVVGEKARVYGRNFIIGEGGSTATVNQYAGTVGVGSFMMGDTQNQKGGLATYNLFGGMLVTSNGWEHIGDYGKTVFNQTGGLANFLERACLAYQAGGDCEYNLSGGELDSTGDWRVGQSGKAVFNVSGGTFSVAAFLHVGAENGSDGTANFTGGNSTMKSRTWIASNPQTKGVLTVDIADRGSLEFKGDVAVGYKGTGTFNMRSGTARQTAGWFYIGQNDGSKGTLNLDGGELEVLRITSSAKADATINANGGTIRATGDHATFIQNVNVNLCSGGLVIDSNGHDISATSGYTLGAGPGAVRKTGAGKLTLSDLPQAKRGLFVDEGTLSIAPAQGASSASGSEVSDVSDLLIHRWTFDGTLDDAVTGKAPKAAIGVDYSDDGKALRLNGGAKWENYVNLGTELLPRDDSPITIEIWATDREYRNWARMFSFGSGQTDLLCINTNAGGEDLPGYLTVCAQALEEPNAKVDFPRLKENRFGRRLYYAIALVPNGDGTANVTFRVKDANTGDTLEEQQNTVNWTPKKSKQTDFYLGVSYWAGNPSPAMDYEEVRFWNAELNDIQMTANVLHGPDVIPTSFDTLPQTVEVAPGATLDLGNRALTLHDLKAGGTLASGNITVDGVLSPGGDGTVGTLTVDGSLTATGVLRLDPGDMIELTGDLTLDGTTIEFTVPMEEVDAYVKDNGGWVVAKTSAGTITMRDLIEERHSFRWNNSGRRLRAAAPGFMITVK